MDSMAKVHPDAVLVAVHNNDPMTVTTYDAGVGTLISGYPTVLIDRKESDDPSNMFAQYTAHKPDFGFADLNLTNTLSGMNLTTQVSTHFAVDLTGNNYQLAYVITEDDVHGGPDGSTWDQHNYYSSASQNIPLSGAGFNFQNEPATIPASRMYYDFVARSIDNSFTGKAGSITTPVTAGSTQAYTFNYTIPAGTNPTKLTAKVLLIDAAQGIVLNAAQQKVNYPQGVTNNDLQNSVYMYPNPATDRVSVFVQSNKGNNFRVDVVNMLGQVVMTENSTSATGNVVLNTSALAAGQYMVRVSNGAEQTTLKLTKN
jgi:hypothetical protein